MDLGKIHGLGVGFGIRNNTRSNAYYQSVQKKQKPKLTKTDASVTVVTAVLWKVDIAYDRNKFSPVNRIKNTVTARNIDTILHLTTENMSTNCRLVWKHSLSQMSVVTRATLAGKVWAEQLRHAQQLCQMISAFLYCNVDPSSHATPAFKMACNKHPINRLLTQGRLNFLSSNQQHQVPKLSGCEGAFKGKNTSDVGNNFYFMLYSRYRRERCMYAIQITNTVLAEKSHHSKTFLTTDYVNISAP